MTPTEVDVPLAASLGEIAHVLLLRDYNTRVVVIGATLLGLGAGVVGSFTLLRKRALMGDALSHATLPGIALAFVVATALGFDGKSLPLLLTGASISGLAGVGVILGIRRYTRLKEDTALGIVLSVFFGAGLALLGVVQQLEGGHAAGLESFIYGKTAAMLARDAVLIGAASAACVAASALLFKELELLCFDAGFAASRGVPVGWLDAALMLMVVVVTIIGLQAVGLILMIALLVTPPAAARFWTDDIRRMASLSGLCGATSCFVGATLSALYPDLPSGATIVLVAAAVFLASAVFGSTRGVLLRHLRRRRFLRRIGQEHLLRSLYEAVESESRPKAAVPTTRLLDARSWAPGRLTRIVQRAESEELVRRESADTVRLTTRGLLEAQRLTRQHRLWELYLITHADVAPSRVDRGADDIEHVLDAETLHQLETLLDESSGRQLPESPHELAQAPSTVEGER